MTLRSALKAHGLVTLTLGGFFLAALWLVHYAASDVVTRDQWHFLAGIDDYYQHGFKLVDLWASHSEHRTPGYKLLFLLNALWFHLNLLLECYIGVVALLLSAVWLYRSYRASLGDSARPLYAQLSFVVLAAVFFSFNQWILYTYSLSALDSFLGNLTFILCWYYLDQELRRAPSRGRFLWVFVPCFLVALLVFGEGRGPAVIVATLLPAALAAFYAGREAGPRRWLACGVLAGVSVLAQAIYWLVGPTVAYNQPLTRNLWVVFSAPLASLEYVLEMLASSVATDQLIVHADAWVLYAIGAAVAVLYLAALWLFWSRRLWSRSYLPLFLMGYSALYLASLLVARFGIHGDADAGAPRYATDLQLGIVGVFWVFYLACFHAEAGWGKWLKASVLVVSVVMLGLQAVNARKVYQFVPFQRTANLDFRAFLLSDKPNKYVTDPPAAFMCPSTDLCEEGTQVLKRYGLTPFQDAATPQPGRP